MSYNDTQDQTPVIDVEHNQHAKALIGLALKVKTRKYWSINHVNKNDLFIYFVKIN